VLPELAMEFGGKNGRWRGLAYAFEADKGAPSTAQVGSRRRSNIASPKPELLWDVKDVSVAIKMRVLILSLEHGRSLHSV